VRDVLNFHLESKARLLIGIGTIAGAEVYCCRLLRTDALRGCLPADN